MPASPAHFALYLSHFAIPFYLSVEPFLSEILGDVVLNNSYSNGFPTKERDYTGTTTIYKIKKKNNKKYFVDIKM